MWCAAGLSPSQPEIISGYIGGPWPGAWSSALSKCSSIGSKLAERATVEHRQSAQTPATADWIEAPQAALSDVAVGSRATAKERRSKTAAALAPNKMH
jgi:hypothetical protein